MASAVHTTNVVPLPSAARQPVAQQLGDDIPDNVVRLFRRTRPAFSPSPSALILAAISDALPKAQRQRIMTSLWAAEKCGDPNAETARHIMMNYFGTVEA